MAGTEPKDFFKQKRTAAEIKAELLPRFLPVWAALVLPDRLESDKPACLFIDLHAAQGMPDHDQPTGAVGKVLRSIYAGIGQNLNTAFQPYFWDRDKPALTHLQEAVAEMPFYPELAHVPIFLQTPEDRVFLQAHLQEELPTLVVADPFGPKYAQEVISQVSESGQSDLLLLFDAAKLKASPKSVSADGPLRRWYGDRAPELAAFYERTSHPRKREEFALASLENTLRDKGYRTVTFRVFLPGKDQPHQYLLFASKKEAACTRLKEILLDYSEYQEDGVPLMSANEKPVRLLVPEYAQYLRHSLHKLVADLQQHGALYNRHSLERIYEKHNVETHYCKANYLTALEKLKEQGKILLLNPKTGQQVHKLSFSCLIKFKEEPKAE